MELEQAKENDGVEPVAPSLAYRGHPSLLEIPKGHVKKTTEGMDRYFEMKGKPG